MVRPCLDDLKKGITVVCLNLLLEISLFTLSMGVESKLSSVDTKSLTIVLMFTTKIDSKLPHRLVANSDYLLTEGFYVLYNPSWVNTMSSNIAPIISHSILSSNLNSHLITTIPANKKATWNDVVFSFRGNSHRKTCLGMRVRIINHRNL